MPLVEFVAGRRVEDVERRDQPRGDSGVRGEEKGGVSAACWGERIGVIGREKDLCCPRAVGFGVIGTGDAVKVLLC